MQPTQLAEVDQVYAFFAGGEHWIVAQGQKPTPCHVVTIAQRPERILPPMFEVVMQTSAEPCIQVVTPYVVVIAVRIGPRAESLRVFTAAGERAVEVVDLPSLDPIETNPLPDPDRPPSVVAANAAGPSALGELIRQKERMDLRILPRGREGRGYSSTYSFEEALRSAIANLPPSPPQCCDLLENIEVTYVGVEVGGIMGVNRLVVRVRA